MRRILIAAAALALSAGIARAGYYYTFEDAFPHLPTFTEPIDIQDPFDGTDRLFVLEKEGKLRVLNNDPSVTTAGVFLDIADSVTNVWESGLIGFTFHPDYEHNGYFYVVYETKDPQRTKLSRFHVSADPNVADRTSELSLIEIRQFFPYHKGGCLTFGPDGYLYMSVGDDGNGDAQGLGNLKGKMLRIDVDAPSGGKNYGIPPDNPFVGQPGKREEIWAFGFRNPWRYSFDAWTGRLWLADVGQDTWEEINVVTKGRNYGWSRMEGPSCLSPPTCDTTGLNIVLPLHAYMHTSEFGGAVVGGNVYRGTRVPSLNGVYLYTDHAAGEVWGLIYDGVNPPVNKLLLLPDPVQKYRFASITTDKDREMFWASYINGRIWQIAEIPSAVEGGTPEAKASLSVHPNPFSSEAKIVYSAPAPSSLEVFDVNGRLVRRVAGRVVGSGEATWDGRDAAGHSSPSGVYFMRLTRDGRPVAMRRVVLLK